MHALLRIVIEPHPAPRLAIDERDLLTAAQIVDGLGALTSRNLVCDAAAIAPTIKSEHQAGFCGGAAVHKRIDAKRPMRPDQTRVSSFKKIESGPPHKRTIGEDPHVFVALIG